MLKRDMERLNECINSYKARPQAQDIKIDLTKLEEEGVDVKDRAGTEEELLNSSTKSPFCQTFDAVCQRMVCTWARSKTQKPRKSRKI